MAFAVIMASGMVSAQPTENTIETNIQGNNIEWDIDTQFNGARDSFEGTADSGNVHQTFTDHNEEWNNFEDIERRADWDGSGDVDVSANYNNPREWYDANVNTWADAESDDGGIFWQRKQATGHGEPTYKVPDKRGIEFNVDGNYKVEYGAIDKRGDDSGVSDGVGDFAYSFSAEGDTGSFLNVEEGNIVSEHGSGKWHNEDGYGTDYRFDWEGNLDSQTTNGYGHNHVDFSETTDWDEQYIDGNGDFR